MKRPKCNEWYQDESGYNLYRVSKEAGYSESLSSFFYQIERYKFSKGVRTYIDTIPVFDHFFEKLTLVY